MVIIALVGLLGISSAFAGYHFVTGTDQGAPNNLQEDQQLYSVGYGDLVNAVSFSGRLIFPNREALAFGVAGTAGEVLIDEGDAVTAGQPLAVLDEESISHLEKAIAQARINVRDAEDALEEARNPYSAAQIAKAEAGVANARLDLRKAEEALSELGVVSPDSLAQARIEVLEFKSDLEEARDSKAKLLSPTVQDIAQAQAAVTAAHIALEEAEDDLEALLSEIAAGPDQLELESKSRAVGSAEAAVLDAEAAFAALMEPDEPDVEFADHEIELAEARLAEVEETLSDLLKDPHPVETQVKQTAVRLAKESLAEAEAKQEEYGSVDELEVELADHEIELAEARLAEVEETLSDLLKDPHPVETQVKQTAVRLAKESLAEAEAKQEEYGSVDELEVELRQTDLVAARTALDVAISNLDRSTLRAPFHGTVDGVYIEVDQQVSANRAILRIAGVSEKFLSFGVPGIVGDVLVVAGERVSAGDALAVMDEDTVANLEKAIAQARIDVRDAEDALEEAKKPKEAQVAQADSDVANARLSLQQAEDELGELGVVSPDTLAQARIDILQARSDLEEARKKRATLLSPTVQDIAQADSDVANARLSLQQAEDELGELGAVSPDTLAQARIDILQARSDLEEAREKRATLLSPTVQDIAQAQADVTAARIALHEANDDLDSFLSEIAAGPDQLELESKSRAVGSAEADVLDVEAAMAALTEPDESDIELADHEIELAEARLAEVEQALADLLEAPDLLEVQVKQTAVRVASESLADAEATLVEYSSVDQLEIDLRQADLIAARATLDTAKTARERATIVAPWTGVISTIAVEPGQKVEAASPVIEIVDESVAEVRGMVDEIDVLFVREGLPVSVTLDALQGQTLRGTVSHVAAAADGHQGIDQQSLVSRASTTTGIVRYAISVRVEKPPDLSLLEGLSGLASVAIREDRGVLLVPLDSVYGSVDQPLLRVMDNGIIEERPVTLGNRDDFWVVVERGISEGETVILEYRDPSEGFGGLIGGLQGLLGAQGATIQTIQVDAE